VIFQEDRPAVWQLADGPVCLALFSSQRTALEYAQVALTAPYTLQETEPHTLSELFIECWQANIRWAVLDPSHGLAKKLFDLREVLKRIQAELRQGQTLSFHIPP
jgi:hypothetical protein